MLDIMEPTIGDTFIEGDIKFKQGLRSSWEHRFVSVKKNSISVHSESNKKEILFTFNSNNSWVSAKNLSSDTGLFFLHVPNETKLYLFECGSDRNLRNWLKAMHTAGWESNININSHNEIFAKQQQFDTSKYNITPLSDNSNYSQFVRSGDFDKNSLERSFSMPSLALRKSKDSLLSMDEYLDIQNSEHLQRKNNNQNSNNNSNIMRYLKTNVSESGYCSKESLLIDHQEHRFTKPRKVSKQDLVAPNITEESADNQQEGASNGIPPFAKVDFDNNIEDVFGHVGQHDDVIYADLDDPDATPKLEKKASMSQIISNLKSKFGNASSRRKGKKGSKRIPRNDVFSGRLLWNPNGQWKDKWFFYQDGLLRGFKEVGFKPADVSIDVKGCTLTQYDSNDMLRRLNIFKLTTGGNSVHVFAAWNEEQYESWVECLRYSVLKREELDGSSVNGDTKGKESESEETFIIPYDRAVSKGDLKTSTSSEASSNTLVTRRVDSIDSGNDGDESGVESSLNSLRYETRKLMKERLKQTPIEECSNLDNDVVDCARKKSSTSELSLDLPDNSGDNNLTSTEIQKPLSPTLEITPSSDDSGNTAVTKRTKRSASMSNRQRWSFYGSKKEMNLKSDEHLTLPQGISKISRPREILKSSENDYESNISHSGSLDSPSSYRASSADSLLNHRPHSADFNHFVPPWENYQRFKKSLSEDDGSDIASMQSSVHDEHKQDEFNEDTLREDTFLRTRRNSLKLKRDQINTQLENLKLPIKKNTKNDTNNNNISEEALSEKIGKLEKRRNELNGQLEEIDKRIDSRITPTYKKKTKPAKKNTPFMGKLRLATKSKSSNIDTSHSMSIESLASSGSRDSRDSSISHESPGHKEDITEIIIPENFEAPPRKKCSSDSIHAKEKLTGFEELIRTTEKLERGKDISNQPISRRSQSMVSIDQLRYRSQFSERQVSRENHNKEQSQLIIEDFERFSEMLSSQMQLNKKRAEIIEV